MESPSCVGYSIPKITCDKYLTNDNQTKYDNYYALQTFLNKFPKFEQNDFYITGELSKLIIINYMFH